jgi:membrane peptidoglycan carboxypeptidase
MSTTGDTGAPDALPPDTTPHNDTASDAAVREDTAGEDTASRDNAGGDNVGDRASEESTPRPRRQGRFRSGEWPVVDLSEAYAAVRRRGTALRRRRIISAVLAAVVLAGVFSIVGVYYIATIPLPDALGLPTTTTVYYSDATTVMARLGKQNRVLVETATLPNHVRAAVVAAEDPGFYLGSATLISRQYARAAADVEGPDGPLASFADASTAVGEARLLVMSWKLEDSYSKDQILGFYLNTVYFGRGAYGIEAAAQAYFGKHSADLTVEEAIVLAGLISSPGDGRFDPTVDLMSARQRFAEVAQQMVVLGALAQSEADLLRLPTVNAYDPTLHESDLDRPTGLAVSQVLAELREIDAFRGKPTGYIENGGYSIVTTIDASAQALLERVADETGEGSIMDGQPDNLQAAAVVVEPGSGRVLAYFGGHDGTGADYAGWYHAPSGRATGYGAHPPGQTFGVYALAAGLAAGISVRSRWDSPETKQFPASGRLAANPVRDLARPPCRPACSLVDATTDSLNVPFFALTERLGAAAVIDTARAVGIDAMWVPESAQAARQRFDLRVHDGHSVSPRPFGTEIALGDYPVTVLDQASAMATFAAGGRRAKAHFVRRVTKDLAGVHTEADPSNAAPVLGRAAVNDLTWTLAQNPAGQVSGGRASATKTGVARLRTSAVETAHAWIVGYTANLAMAVWIGNEEIEFPLKDREGARVTGDGLPAEIYRTFMSTAHDVLRLPAVGFEAPSFTGDDSVGDAG